MAHFPARNRLTGVRPSQNGTSATPLAAGVAHIESKPDSESDRRFGVMAPLRLVLLGRSARTRREMPVTVGLRRAAEWACWGWFRGVLHGGGMLRSLLCGIAAGLVLSAPAPARANDDEDKAAAYVEKIGGKVTRDEKRPG